MHKVPELLAPAGHIESFHAALENGADAVYLGLKRLSARAGATNFSLDELSFLVPYAHGRNVKIYVALNSALTAMDFPGVLDLLQSLEDLQVDALIVQDPGIFFLVRKFFPKLKLHASTLMTIHNSAGVNQLERIGASRVVLARELTMEEIRQISENTEAELEIFVHGALCYSYSGLCLASSFRGGHSGLQGRCAQPCRLNFHQGRKEGYFISCNDLCALSLMPRLKQLRLAALKIEGRMKTADYIANVVRAYRMVLDADPAREKEAIAGGQTLLDASPSRRLTQGYFTGNYNTEVLSPHRSGSSGLWVGTVKQGGEEGVLVELRHELRAGDRLRPESRSGKEEEAFTVTRISSPDGRELPLGRRGKRILIDFQGSIPPGTRLFKVGAKHGQASGLWQEIRKVSPQGLKFRKSFHSRENVLARFDVPASGLHRGEETLFLKVARPHHVAVAFQAQAQWVLLSATKSNLEQFARQRLSAHQKVHFIWSLPALLEEKDLGYYRSAIEWYRKKGFGNWEVNNWGHFDFFPRSGRTKLLAGYRLNTRNMAAMAQLAEEGCRWTVLSVETTREELEHLGGYSLPVVPIITVYIWPPLFVSRLIPKLQEEKAFFTPRRESLSFRKVGQYAYIYPDRPVNWFGQIPHLKSLGYRNFLMDLGEGPADLMGGLEKMLNDFRHYRAREPYSLFNYDRKP